MKGINEIRGMFLGHLCIIPGNWLKYEQKAQVEGAKVIDPIAKLNTF